MSLSRILNEHPAPPSLPPVPAPQFFNNAPPHLVSPHHERSLSPSFPPRTRTPISRQAQSSPVLERHVNDFPSRSGGHHDSSVWEDVGEWRQSSRSRNGNMEIQREASPSSVQEYKYGKNDESNAIHKKRKRGADDDGDYRPPLTRRVCKYPLH